MEINNLDHAIELSTKKYPYNRIFVNGGEKWWAPAPNPTVYGSKYFINNWQDFFYDLWVYYYYCIR